jgi:Fe-S-cluster-containing hydrogenase component 2
MTKSGAFGGRSGAAQREIGDELIGQQKCNDCVRAITACNQGILFTPTHGRDFYV